MPILESMKSFVVLSANGISNYAFQPLTQDGSSALASALERARHFPDYAGTIITAAETQCAELQAYCDKYSDKYEVPSRSVTHSGNSEMISDTTAKSVHAEADKGGADLSPVRVIPVAAPTASAFFKAIAPFAAEADHFFIAWADAPFLDTAGAEQLYAQHCKYKAEYSFADGYPEGLIPQIIASGLAPILAELPHAADILLSRSFIFDTIKTDINSYDLETMIAPDDVRSLRLAFYTDTKAAWTLCRQFSGITAQNYAAYIDERQDCLRTIPAYYGIEITAYHPLRSIYRPNVFPGTFTPDCCMDFERAVKLIDDIAAFSETAVISLSLFGEPLLHAHFSSIVLKILSYPNLSVLIETSGATDTAANDFSLFEELANRLRALPPRANKFLPIYWIIDIDAVGSKMYGSVHQLPDSEAEHRLKQAATFADRLATLFPKAVYAQMIRMNENEAELEPFFRLWEKRDAKPLIQKYDHLCGTMPDRRPADISPLKRHPCWHLKRDMSILTDGTVPLCKEDCSRSIILGNAFTESLETIWERGRQTYQDQITSCYKGVCEHCDEYYTYNF